MGSVEGCSLHKQGKPEHVVVAWTNWQWQVTCFAGSCKLVAGDNKLLGHVWCTIGFAKMQAES